MPTYERKKMCKECPFAQDSIKGWLGPWSIEDFENFVRFDGTFICHMDVARLQGGDDSEECLDDEEIEEQGHHCVGMLRYMSGMCKLSRDLQKAQFQNEIKTVKDRPVLKPNTFREHHTLKKGRK